MSLSKIKLGKLIRLEDEKNLDALYSLSDVRGISIQKKFIDTKANMDGVSLSPYLLVRPGYFAYVTVTSRNGEKITIAHNTSDETYIVSSSYVVFSVIREDLLNSDYLFMYFNRPEFDRYARYNSWGSARETFSWEDMCDIDIELPSLSIQEKYVSIYNAMLINQKSYERGLDDLKLTCDAYVENLRKKYDPVPIGDYLIESDRRNMDCLPVEQVRGLATSKEMIPTKADMSGVSLDNYKTVAPGQIAYVSDTSRRADKVSLGFNDTMETFLVSSISTVFSTDEEYLLPRYLMLFLTRSEFDRYARYNSWGSARETFSFEEMCCVKIPVPPIDIQRSISNIYTIHRERRYICEKLKSRIGEMCPILIKGAIEEAKKEA